jgi:hypothetical protein
MARGEQLAANGYRIGKRAYRRRGIRRTPECEAMFYGLPAESVFARTYQPPPEHETLPHGRVVTLVRDGRPVADRLV